MSQAPEFTYRPDDPIDPESTIQQLLRFGENEMPDQELLAVLRQFKLSDALETVASCSWYVMKNGYPTPGRGIVLRHPAKGVLITQYALSYLSMAFVRSGASEASSYLLSHRAQSNLFALCNIANLRPIDPVAELENRVPADGEMSSLFLRLSVEQFPFQEDYLQMAGRAWALFVKLPSEVDSGFASELDVKFHKQLGMHIKEYLTGAATIIAAGGMRPCVSPRQITESELVGSMEFARPATIEPLFRLLSGTTDQLRSMDELWNSRLDERLCKYRLSPLLSKPMIRYRDSVNTESYLVANSSLLWKSVYDGLYWHLHSVFERSGEHLDFRKKFGRVIERYVGMLLKSILNPGLVISDFQFRGSQGSESRFCDWWIDAGSDLYLFEAKSTQLTLAERQGAEQQTLKERVGLTVAEAICQLWRLVKEIENNEELRNFAGKRIHSFIIVRDVPLISAGFYNDFIIDALKGLISENEFSSILDFPVSILDLSDFEICHWDMLSRLGSEPLRGMRESVLREPVEKIRPGFLNSFVEKSYQEYAETMVGEKTASEMRLRAKIRGS